MSFENWTEGLAEICSGFQVDLSCLVDGELDESAATRAVVHMEGCTCCRDFFEDTRRQVRLHKDMSDPERLIARVAALVGRDIGAEVESIDLVHRLASIFYQLGKAYVLTAIDPHGLEQRVFEEAVAIEGTKTQGRGFVDGVLMAGKGDGANVDWRQARHLLNGRLERIEEPLEKGKRLLQEAIDTDASHEEARIYQAFVAHHEGRVLKAAELYRDVFDTALDDANRGHSAIQLGLLHFEEGDVRKSLGYLRWLTMSGLADRDDRFWAARFNIGLAYAKAGDQDRALDYWRRLLDTAPDHLAEITETFAQRDDVREIIESTAGLPEGLFERCPELFETNTTQGGAD